MKCSDGHCFAVCLISPLMCHSFSFNSMSNFSKIIVNTQCLECNVIQLIIIIFTITEKQLLDMFTAYNTETVSRAVYLKSLLT